jgi:hypothetical protein
VAVSKPHEVARYTVEQSGGEYVTPLPDLLALFGRKQLTDRARDEIRGALAREGVGTEPDLFDVRRSDTVRLFLMAREPVRFSAPAARPSGPAAHSWWESLRPRGWKGWAFYGIAGLLIVGALAGDSEDSGEPRSVTEGAGREPAAATSGSSERTRAERARSRRKRAQARRERARRARAVARSRRERRGQIDALAAPPPSEAESGSNCHPSYEPCLDANAGDYDCDGGSGDGPGYTGTVAVKGPDEYDLDSDADGTGCDP